MDENNPYLGVPNQCKQAQIKDIDFNPYLGVPNRYDQAQIKDIDFSVDQAAYDKAIRFWEVYVEKAPLKSGEDPTKFQSTFPPEFFTGLYKSKENYAEEQSTFSPWAFVTPDGKWIKKGVSYWWLYYTEDMKHLRAFSAALEKTLSECDPEWYITIVDCQSYFGV